MAQGLATELRPNTFENVYGQVHAIRMLQTILRSKERGQNVLLWGAVGSGKTTLARIYAKALNCLSPAASGSPCGQCVRCTAPDDERDYHEINVPAIKLDIVGHVSSLNSPPLNSAYRVIFLDEVHALGRRATGLLKLAEEHRDDVVLIMATTEPSLVDQALLSRFVKIEIRALPKTTAFKMLREVAELKGIEYENDALLLIAGLSNGHPRDMLTRLQSLPKGLRLTRELVAETFNIYHEDVLVEYFSALAAGDFKRQLHVLENWHESTNDKLRWIQCLIVKLSYLSFGLKVDVDPIVDSIPENKLRMILTGLEISGLPSSPESWQELLRIFASPIIPSNASLQLQLAQFHHHVNFRRRSVQTDQEPLAQTSNKPSGARNFDGFDPRPLLPADIRPRPPEPEPSENFLGHSHVRTVVNTASFLIQHHNKLFNARFSLVAATEPVDEAETRELVQRFLRELNEFVGADGRRPLYWIAVAKCGQSSLRHRVVLSLPTDNEGKGGPTADEIQRWVRQRPGRPRPWYSEDFQMSGAGQKETLRFHWRQVMSMLDGLSYHVVDWDDRTNQWLPLRNLLQIPQAEEESRLTQLPLVDLCPLLSQQAIIEACRWGMTALSAFDARAWRSIRAGWELNEYRDRMDEISQRDYAVEEFRLRQDNKNMKDDAVVSSLGFDIPAQRRLRSWRGWWVDKG